MAKEMALAKDSQFVLVNTAPDVCLTPTKKDIPVPYPITHNLSQSNQCSPNVFFAGKPAYMHEESYVDNVKGDEPGMGGGVVSGTNTKISRSIDHSHSVYVNGRRIVRTADTAWMNRKKY